MKKEGKEKRERVKQGRASPLTQVAVSQCFCPGEIRTSARFLNQLEAFIVRFVTLRIHIRIQTTTTTSSSPTHGRTLAIIPV
jgi:hypothetical protein